MKDTLKRWAAGVLAAVMLCGPGSSLAVCAEGVTDAISMESREPPDPEPSATPPAESTSEEPVIPPSPEPETPPSEEPDPPSSEPGTDREEPADSETGSAAADGETHDLGELLPGEQGSYTITQDESGSPAVTFNLEGGSEQEDGIEILPLTPNEDAEQLDMSEYEQGWDDLGQALTYETGVSSVDLDALLLTADDTREALDAALAAAPAALSDEDSTDLPALALDTEAYPNARQLNKTDWSKVEILTDSTAAVSRNAADPTAVVYMVDREHVLIRVTKEDGTPIDGATVTIQLKDKDGNLVGQPQTAVTAPQQDPSGSDVPGTEGVVLFKTKDESCYGVMDVQYNGYRTRTLLDAELTGGTMQTVQLKPVGDAQYYLRCVDLAGADLLYDKTSLDLVNLGSQMTFTVMLCRVNESTPWPQNVETNMELVAVNKEVERIVSKAVTQEEFNQKHTGFLCTVKDAKTLSFTMTAAWGGATTELFKAGDTVKVRFSDPSVSAELGMTVQRAICPEATYSQYKFSLSPLKDSTQVSTSIPGQENLKIGMEIPAIPVSVMVLPDGTYFVGASLAAQAKDLINFINGTPTPRQQDKARDEMQGLQNLMNDKLDKLEEGLATADKMSSSAEQKGAWGDPSKSVLVSAMFGFLGGYNKNTGMEVAGGRIFVSVIGKYDHTYTSFIMVGAVPLPWYWGIQASASGGLDVSLFYQTKVPVEQTNNNAMVKAICNPDGISSTGSNVTLSLAFSIGIYVGLGVRKVLCVEGSGSLGLTMSICMFNNYETPPPGRDFPHVTGAFQAGLTLSATALFFSVSYTIGGKWPYNVWEPLRPSSQPQSNSPTPVSMDLSAVSETDTTEGSYASNASPLLASRMAGSSLILDDVQGDTQMQLVNVNNTEYLFRIASVGGKPRLVYQEVGSNNVNDIHIVSPKSAEGAPLDVVRYAVMVDEEDVNCVYIALVTADYDGTTEYTARANSTRMFGLTWDVSGHKSTESFLVPKEKENEIQNPMVTGTDGHCVPVWYQKGLGLCWYNNQTKEQYRTSANSGNLLLTGKVEPGKAMYFLVRANGSSLMLRGFDCYGKATQETITLPLSTPLTWTGPMISASCVSEGFVYFIIGSHFFMYSTYNGSISEAHWLSESGQYLEGDVFDGIGGSEACQLVIAPGSNDDTYGCLIQLTPDTKLETVTGENNTVDYVQTLTGYTVSNFFFTKSTGRLRVTDPETYQLVDPNSNETVKPISSFCATAHYNGSKNAVESVQLLYTVPNADSQSNVRSCDVYSWTHTLTDGVQAESISPRKDLISKNDSYFYVEATVRNTTSGRNVEHLLLSAKDEQNRSILFLPEGGGVLPEVYAVDHVIAPGMASTLGFWLRIPNEWEQGAHTITLSACVNNNTNSRTNENDWVPLTTLSVASDPALTMDVDLSYPVDANGQQKITGHVTITNLSMNPTSFNGLKLVMQNGKNITNTVDLKDFSGLNGSVTDASQTGGVWLNHSYNLSVDLTGQWGDADYIALYLTSTTLTDAQKASLIQRTKVILETPTPDVYTHVGTAVERPLTGTTEGDKGYVANEGGEITLKATANEGYRFVRWVDSSGKEVSTAANWTFRPDPAPGDHVVYTAVFEDDTAHTLTVEPTESTVEGESIPQDDGAVTVDGSLLSIDRTGGTLQASALDGTELTLSAEPYDGFQFSGWYENNTLLGTEPTLTLTLTASRTLEARFAPLSPGKTVSETEATQETPDDTCLSFALQDAGCATLEQAMTLLQNGINSRRTGSTTLSDAKLITIKRSLDGENWSTYDVLPDGETATVLLTLPGAETTTRAHNQPGSISANTDRPIVAVLYQDAVDGHRAGEVLCLTPGSSVGATSLAVVDDHTLQLTLRGSALVLTAWGGTDVSTPTPTPRPVSDHPEIGEAIRNGTWGVDESTPAPATQAPAAASSGAAGGSGTKPKATTTPSSTPVSTVAPAPSDSSADSASPTPSSAPSDVVEPTSPEQNPSPSPALPVPVIVLLVVLGLGGLGGILWLLISRRRRH